MAFDTYSNFRTSVSTWLDVSDVTTTALDDLIRVAENRVNRELRVRLMETSLAVTINSATGYAAIPPDYLDMQFAYIDATPISRLQKKSAEWIYGNYKTRSATGIPKFFAEAGGNFVFGPAPDSDYVLTGIYYGKPASMPGNSTVHAVFSEYPELYLFATLSESSPFLRQDQRLIWEAKYTNLLNLCNGQDKKRRLSGTPLMMTAE